MSDPPPERPPGHGTRPVIPADSERRAVALSDLASRAAVGVPVASLLDDLANVAAIAVRADVAVLLEHRPEGHELVLRAAVGLPDDLLGQSITDDRGTQVGFALVAGTPVFSIDVGLDPRFGLPAPLADLGLRASVAVVMHRGAVPWGVLGVATTSDRRFGADDLRFLQSAANVVGAAIERHRVEQVLVESQARLDLALDTARLGIWEYHFDEDRVWASPSLERLLGFEPGTFDNDPQSVLERVHPDDLDAVIAALRMDAQQGPEWHHAFRVGPPGEQTRWLEAHARAVVADDGTLDRVVGVAADITERRLAEEIRSGLMARAEEARLTAEAARERFSFLAEASAVLAGSLDAASTAGVLVDLAVPRLADWAFVDLLEAGGVLTEAAVAHAEPERADDARRVRHLRRDLGGDGLWSVRRAIRTGTADFVPDISDDDLCGVAADAEHLALLRRLAPRSAVAVPLLARGQALGGLTLVRSEGSLRFDADDLALVEGLAARAAVALDNARLYAERERVVRALQETLLPPALPDIAGLDVAARYRVAEGDIDIGGDFYDVFPLPNEAWAVVVGDVSGKGPSAAAVTGLVRHALRAVALSEPSPARVLAATNAALGAQVADSRFCTAVLLHVEAHDGGARVVAANAGHPHPFLYTAGGSASMVEAQGTLLGVVDDPALTDVAIDLAAGDALILVTDGVTEARRGTDQFGEQGVLDCLSLVGPGASAARLAAAVVDAATAHAGGDTDDDTAVVVVRAEA